MRPVTDQHTSEREARLVRSVAMRRIIVTRGLVAGDRLIQRLNELGATVVHCPCVAMQPPHDERPLEQAARTVARYDWLLFTSPNAVDAFSRKVAMGRQPISSLGVSVGCVGSSSATAAREFGWRVEFVPVRNSGTGLANEIPVTEAQRILLPRADIASAEMPALLRARGCDVTEVVAYRTVDATTDATVAELRGLVHVDAISFTSPSTVRHLHAASLRAGWNMVHAQREQQLCIVCIGETTADEVRRHGLNVDAIARDQSAEGLVEALAAGLEQRGRVTPSETHAPWSQ